MSRDVDSALPSKLALTPVHALIGLRPWVAHMSSPLMRLLESQPLDSDSEVYYLDRVLRQVNLCISSRII